MGLLGAKLKERMTTEEKFLNKHKAIRDASALQVNSEVVLTEEEETQKKLNKLLNSLLGFTYEHEK